MNQEAATNSLESEQDLQALAGLISAVDVHNHDHSWGAAMGKTIGGILSAVIDKKEPDIEAIQKDVVTEHAGSANVGMTELLAGHERTLHRFGITLEQESLAHREQDASGTVVIKIKDPASFIKRLRTVRPLLASERHREKGVGVLTALVGSLEKQVGAADFADLPQGDKNVLDSLPLLVGALRDTDPTQNIQHLETYGRFQATGRLANYVAVEHENLWQEPGKGFGPADWVRDTTPQRLNEYWGRALATLNMQERMDNSGVAPELREHLLHCIVSASETLKGANWPENTKKAMEEILSKHAKALRGKSSLN